MEAQSTQLLRTSLGGCALTIFLLPKAVMVLNQKQVHTLAQTVHKLSSFLDLEYIIFQMIQIFHFPYHDMTAFVSVLLLSWGNLNSNLQV